MVASTGTVPKAAKQADAVDKPSVDYQAVDPALVPQEEVKKLQLALKSYENKVENSNRLTALVTPSNPNLTFT